MKRLRGTSEHATNTSTARNQPGHSLPGRKSHMSGTRSILSKLRQSFSLRKAVSLWLLGSAASMRFGLRSTRKTGLYLSSPKKKKAPRIWFSMRIPPRREYRLWKRISLKNFGRKSHGHTVVRFSRRREAQYKQSRKAATRFGHTPRRLLYRMRLLFSQV